MKRRRPEAEPTVPQETEYGAMFERMSSAAGRQVESLFREVDVAAGLLAEMLGASRGRAAGSSRSGSPVPFPEALRSARGEEP